MWDGLFMPWGAAAAEGGEGGGASTLRGPREAPGELLWVHPTRAGRELAAALAPRPGDPETGEAEEPLRKTRGGYRLRPS